MNKVPHCSECEYLKMYDYIYKNYYCDNEDRTDDMGKLGVDHPPKTSPVWCPLRCKVNNIDGDDPDLSEAPKLGIYKETFGGLERVTD